MSIDQENARSRYAVYGLSAAAVLGLVVWMASGHVKTKPDSADTPAPAETKPAAAKDAAAPAKVFTVAVEERRAQPVTREVRISGDTQPERVIEFAAQAEGEVWQLLLRKGAQVRKGQVIAKLDPRDWAQHRERALASLRQGDLEYAAAKKLRETGHVTEGELAAKYAQLQAAKSLLADADFQIRHLQITAPVGGILEELHIETGSYARTGQTVGKIIVTDPLLVAGGVSENDIAGIKTGLPAQAEVAGQKLDGRVRFVSAMADPKTRTFTIEISVDNAAARLPAGLSATVTLPVGESRAHRLPASLLTLADDGSVGVKTVDADNRVVYTQTTLLRADGDAVWVAGLPEQIRLITQGQGFVKAGETVQVQAAGAAATPTAAP